MQATKQLPPGQRPREDFPRFGGHLSKPPPAVPDTPTITISGAVTETFEVPLARLATLPRQQLTADFHCVAGWSATDLRWEGVSFATVYRTVIQPALAPDTSVTHVVFNGLDGWRSVVTLQDALAEDVLIAENLDGRPLDGDHGAPARVVSPQQYGYVSTKHLCGIELHTAEPDSQESVLERVLFGSHPRARVWQEERHGLLPPWAVRWVLRPVFRALIAPIAWLSARGSQETRDPRP